MKTEEHKGADKKLPMNTLLAPYEKKLITHFTPKIPSCIRTYHLTLMTILWSAGIIGFGFMAVKNIHWLWASSFMIFLQWLTDAFDGAVGRYQNEGLVKWGFYMDHLLDFIFLSAIFIGYSFMLEGHSKQLMYFFLPVFSCFMINSFLAFGATGEFKITFLGTGPTEVRIGFIVLNTLLIIFGTVWIQKLMLPIFAISLVLLIIVTFRTQKYIWKIDKQIKAELEAQTAPV